MPAVQLFNESDVSQHYEFLDTCGFLGEGNGYLRAAYSDRETQAMNHFKEWAEARGASVLARSSVINAEGAI